MSDSLRPRGLQHARLPSPRVAQFFGILEPLRRLGLGDDMAMALSDHHYEAGGRYPGEKGLGGGEISEA